MKLYRNAIILVVVAALLVGAYFFISSRKTTDNNTDNTSNIVKLSDYTSDEIESVTLENAEGTFVIVKKDDKWTLSTPTDIVADSSVLSSIVINSSSISVDKLIEGDAKDLSLYGLDKPNVVVTVKPKEGDEIVIDIGNKTPTNSGYYVKLHNENNVYILSSYSGDKLYTDKNGLRTTSLYTITADKINKFSLERNGENVFAAELDNNTSTWNMLQPIKGSVNPSAISPMLEAFTGVTVKEFVEDNTNNLSAYGLDKPLYTIEFSTTDSGSYKISLGKEKSKGSEMYALISGYDEVFTIDSSAFTFLDKPIEEIAEVFAYIVNIQNVKAIDLTMDGKTTNMTIDCYVDADGKTNTDKDKFTVNGIDASGKNEDGKQPFRNFYQALIGVSLDKVDPDANPTLTNPEITINYTLKEGSMKVEYVSKDDKYYYVFRNGEYAGLLTKKNKVEYGVQGLRNELDNLMKFIGAK
jgi:hypothetical protein